MTCGICMWFRPAHDIRHLGKCAWRPADSEVPMWWTEEARDFYGSVGELWNAEDCETFELAPKFRITKGNQ